MKACLKRLRQAMPERSIASLHRLGLWPRCALATGVFLPVLVAWLLLQPSAARYPFLVFYPVLAVSALLFGFGPGLLTTLLAACAVLAGEGSQSELAMPVVVFLISGWLVSLLALRSRRDALRFREAEQRFQDVAASSADWFWEVDREMRVTYISENFGRITGLDPQAWHGRLLWQEGASLTMIGENGATFPLEFPLTLCSRDGEEHLFILKGLPFRDANGVLAGYRGAARKMSARHQAEMVADRANRLLREAVGEIAFGFTIFDENDRLVVCNESYRGIYEASRDLIVPGASFAEIVRGGALRGQYRGAEGNVDQWVAERVAQHQNPTGQAIEQELGDGRWLLIVENRTASGFIVGNRIDITERKRAELEQQRLTRALRLLTECNTAVVHSGDEKQLLLEICQKVVATGGYPLAWIGFARNDRERTVEPVASAGASTGDDIAYLLGIRVSWAAGSESAIGPVGRAIRTGQPQVIQDAPVDSDMREWHEALAAQGYRSIVALPLWVGGMVIGALTIYAPAPGAFTVDELALLGELANNLSFGLQSLRSRLDLDRHRRNLEHLVAERTEEISRLNRQLAERAEEAEAANRAKSNFLATMSHEIRTPINAVVGLTDLLTETVLNRRQWDCVHKIQLSAESLKALIDDILDFSKIEAGALELERAPFSLNKTLRSLAAIVSVGARGKPVEIVFDIPRDIPDQLIGDSLRLQQVLLNLGNNAVKFTESGDIVIAVRQLAATGNAVSLAFAVRDTGIGIPADKLSQIFDVFTQADSSISRTHGGSGLGLAICARLAEMMGGRITVESTVGCGSEFRFVAEFALASGAPSEAMDAALEKLRLLIVDDHPLVRANLLRACAEFGWQAMAVDSGASALAELARSAASGEDYDLMLLDWRMPGMDGLRMLREARRTPGIGLPLVVLMAQASEVAEVIAASDDDYLDGVLAKPIWPASLYEAVKNAWSGEFPEMQAVPARTDRRLAGRRLLVAEDNAINRELIESMLLRAGADVVLAVNGRAAVDELRRPGERFDGVLMDIQMPVMDGFAATRIIREELGLRDLPIIAVTAHAGAKDIERSRQVGMNGVVLKPVQVADLLDFIVAGGTAGEFPANPKKASLLALPGLEPNALERFDGNAEYYVEILRQFASRHGNEVSDAAARFASGEYAEAARMVHQLGGVAAFLRATEVPKLTVAIEKALHGDAPQAAAPLFQSLEVAMRELLASIQRFPVAGGEGDRGETVSGV